MCLGQVTMLSKIMGGNRNIPRAFAMNRMGVLKRRVDADRVEYCDSVKFAIEDARWLRC